MPQIYINNFPLHTIIKRKLSRHGSGYLHPQQRAAKIQSYLWNNFTKISIFAVSIVGDISHCGNSRLSILSG